MMKIFTTQLQGLFTKINENEQMAIEDGARLLAQAAIGEGKIYIHGFAEMEAITLEATIGQEPLSSVARLFDDKKQMVEVSTVDRVLLITRYSTDEDAVKLAQELMNKGIEIVAISALVATSDRPSLDNIADIHIDSKLVKPLIPHENGSRFGFPSIITALYAYHGLAFSIKEMVEEYLEEDE